MEVANGTVGGAPAGRGHTDRAVACPQRNVANHRTRDFTVQFGVLAEIRNYEGAAARHIPLMTSSPHRGACRAVLTLALFGASASAAGSASAQGPAPAFGNVSTIVVSDYGSGGNGYTNSRYTADRSAGSSYSGVVNLWFRDANGAVKSGCTGSLLTGGKILTAAHCISNVAYTSFTARFYQTGTGWVDVQGTEMVAKTGYVPGNVVSENDVAVLTLSSVPPSFARTYSLAVGPVLGQTITLAGYGRVGFGSSGDATDNNQLNDAALLRTGKNVFETTCITDLNDGTDTDHCATNASGLAATRGGILLADFDINEGDARFGATPVYPDGLCGSLGFCTPSVGNAFEEVLTGRGDSGGANFLSDWTVAGVTSFGWSNGSVVARFGYQAGYTCVANIEDNAGCQSNYEWVNAQITTVPEPGTVGLVAAGLLAMAGVVRRRSRERHTRA